METVEREAHIQRRLANSSSPAGVDGVIPAGGEADGGAKGDLSHLMDADTTSPTVPFVSKRSLQQAVEGSREELRNWLDMLHASMLNALQQKADHDNVKEIVHQLTQAAGIAGDSIAHFAKR